MFDYFLFSPSGYFFPESNELASKYLQAIIVPTFIFDRYFYSYTIVFNIIHTFYPAQVFYF